MEELTPRQQEVLAFITEFINTRGYPPTQREIAGHLGINGTLAVMRHLQALEKKGYLTKSSGSSRGIVLAGHSSRAVSLPVVGTVRAGLPQPAIEDIEGYFAIDSARLPAGASFFLRVRGDSMIGASILEGDLALIRPQPSAENREIVVALIDGEATLKRFFRERDKIRLAAANPNYDDIIVRQGEGEVTIIGKVVGIYRPLE
ncbi:MAG TPA: transcriptional repressor LexA [bacterium]|nr:transcriptional repressor LexA [bacterium]